MKDKAEQESGQQEKGTDRTGKSGHKGRSREATSGGGGQAQVWYKTSAEGALERLDSDRQGLSGGEAESRLQEHGPNTIRTEQKVSAWQVLLHQFKSPLIYVLLGALAVVLGLQFWGQESHWGDIIVISAVLIVNTVIGFIQEYRAESAVQSLMKMVSPKATVRRDGEEQQIEGEKIVPGDIVLISEGDMIPADVRLVEATSLQINESALTGESVPATKTADALEEAEKNLPPADQSNMGFMGTAVTSGHAVGLVVATGQQTELGQIAHGVREAETVETPLMRRMNTLAKWITAAILLVAAGSFAIGIWMGRSLTDMFLLAVSLSVAAIPAGLPVVMTVALAIGVRRMARRHAVIRHLPAVETLGSTTVIISDKTGTLTQNSMTTRQIAAGDSVYEVTGKAISARGGIEKDGEAVEVEDGSPLYFTLLSGLLNNTADLQGGQDEEEQAEQEEVEQQHERDEDRQSKQEHRRGEAEEQREEADRQQQFQPQGDPMEVALLVAAAKAGMRRADLLDEYPQIEEVPFKTERRFSATIHDVPNGQGPLVLIKGAPEAILDMCKNRMTEDGKTSKLDREQIEQQSDELAGRGLRMLAMAIGRGDQTAKSIHEEQPGGMTFVGMQGLMDPPRPSAIEAVDNCHESGIRVVMVTGDHARTAAAIADKVHLGRAFTRGDEQQRPEGELPEVHSGQEIADISDEKLDELLDRVDVYSRVKPNQKLRIVERFKAHNEVVAVTGDGVNDAPALKSAHLGAAMGRTGTDVAKEASDMVITDDNFASVYSAVEEGRTAFRNIRMATFFLLSTGAADVLIIVVALLAGWPLPLLPAQILWCNVVTNGIADVALGFEPGEKALYKRKPRPPSEGILDRMLLERLVVVGIWLSAGTLGVFYWIKGSEDIFTARVAALTTLVLFQKVHVFNCRSEDVSIFKKSLLANKVLLIGVLTSLGIHIGAMYFSWTQELISLKPLGWETWLVMILVAATAIVVNESHKYFRPREKVNQTWPELSRFRPGRSERREKLEQLDQRLDRIQDQLQGNRQIIEQVAKGGDNGNGKKQDGRSKGSPHSSQKKKGTS